MFRLAAFCGMLTILAAAAGGCAQSADRPYQSAKDLELARRSADLVVEGTVTETLAGDRRPVDTFVQQSLLAGNPVTAGTTNMDCIVKTRVTLAVAHVVKSASAVSGPVRFWYESPCYAIDPDVMLGSTLSDALTQGRPLRVYLVNRGGEWWLIAHERWNGSNPTPVPPSTPSTPVPAPPDTLPGTPPSTHLP
jgi:hypothetical protein